jgi:DNA polymerase-3 subunit delta
LPPVSQTDVRKQIAAGRVGPIYLIVGADEAGKVALAGEFLELVEPELRAFNLDRLYGGETTGMAVVDAARTLPMMVPRRVVMLLHAERLLEPKKDNESTEKDLDALENYIKSPVDASCLVIVGNLDKRKRLAKLLLSKAAVVECSGPADVGEAARWVKDRVAQDGMSIDARAARLVAERVGPDIARLRADVERLMLFAAGNKAITAEDVLEVVGPPTSQDNWGVTNAIERGAAADALRELGMMMDDGAVPYMILGQLAWFVRTKVPAPRVTAAVEAVFRTDLAIKTSAGDPRALLERLVVELCSR